jgi:hypothetical protein
VGTRSILPALLLTSLALGGCGGDDDRPAVWSYISPAIVQPNCATSSCHSRVAAVAGLDLSTAEMGWKTLTQQKLPPIKESAATRGDANRPLVIPFNPAQSRMVNMLHAFGTNRMPPDRPLAEADIALIEQWVLMGAKND